MKREEYEVIRGEEFSKQHIVVDGKRLINCRFIGTDLLLESYNAAEFINPTMIDVTWAFKGPASRTLKTLSFLYNHPAFRLQAEKTIQQIKEGKMLTYPEPNTKFGPLTQNNNLDKYAAERVVNEFYALIESGIT